MLLYISFLTVTGIVSGIYLLKVTVCNWWKLFWQSFWSFWKWSWVQELPPRWTNHCPRWLFRNSPWKPWQGAALYRRGKLKIGPFYILQDDYLISSEANVRNTLIGQAECAKWGKSTQIGYFPDTFGNMGQAPQILKNQAFTWPLLVVVWSRLDLTTKSLKWAVYFPVFRNVLAGCGW